MNKILKFGADWCTSCIALSKTLAGTKLPVEVVEVDSDVDPQLASKYGVRGLPTMVLVNKDGEEIRRLVGSKPLKEIEAFAAAA